jgi:streptogramin lyase
MRAWNLKPSRTAALAAFVLALVAGCATTRPANPPRATTRLAGPPRRAATTRPADPSPPVHAVLERHFRIRAGIVALASGDGGLWVSGFGMVSRIDAATGRLTARIAAPHIGDMSQAAVGGGSIWLTGDYNAADVYRIDPATNQVSAIIATPGPPLGVTVGAGRVWVAIPRQGPGEVAPIDPRTDRITGPPAKVGLGPSQLAYGDGAVWVQNTSPASVMRIDPVTGRTTTIIAAAAVSYGSPVVGGLAVGYGSLWATANDHLTRLDPWTAKVIASLSIPRATDVALGAGEVWVLGAPRSTSPAVFHPVRDTTELYEVDPRTDRTVGRPLRLSADEPIALVATSKYVWVGDYLSGTVTQFRLVRRPS